VNIRSRIGELEEKCRQQADEITLEARGDKFLIGGREITPEELRELSARYQKIVVTNYLDDAGAKILENLKCDVEVIGKRYIGISPNDWD